MISSCEYCYISMSGNLKNQILTCFVTNKATKKHKQIFILNCVHSSNWNNNQ